MRIIGSIILLFLILDFANAQNSLEKSEFLNPPQSAKLHTWWHWMAGNVTKDGITKDLESMKQHGIVQASILNIGEIYSKEVDVPKIKFNSPEWIEMFQWALKEANRLGITIGVMSNDGFATTGGPWVKPELSMKQYVWTTTSIDGGKDLSIKLPQPVQVENFYRDEMVVAFPKAENTNSFQKAQPHVEVNKIHSQNFLYDGNPTTEINFKKGAVIDIQFNSEFTCQKLALLPHLAFSWDLCLVDNGRIKLLFSLSSSKDGKNYSKIADIESVGVNKTITIDFPVTTAKFFRLELIKTSFVYFDVLPIAEFELLKDGELSLFQPPVTSFFEKIASVYDLAQNALDNNDKELHNTIAENSVIDISRFMKPDGTLNWNAPKGRWQVIRFGYTSTGVKVDPATPEGLGLEVDKMDTAALNVHFNSYAKKLIDAAGIYKGTTFKFFLQDSWEAHFQTWTKAFAQEFKNRRGYSIVPWIPVLCGETIGSTNLSEAFLHDFRKTIAEMLDQNYYRHFVALCHRNQMEFHGEVIYGGWGAYPPMDALKANEYSDLVMTEFWANANANNLIEYKPSEKPGFSMPTYSALAFNKQIIGAESYTGFAHYSETPADLKPFGDAAFCSGVNQLILHSFVHQPFDKKPGMTLGKFGGHYNRNNPVWEYNYDWMTYQARVQYVLQKGEPVVDVLFYMGDQLPLFFHKSFVSQLPYGIQPNAINPDILKNRLDVIDGRLSIGGKQRFSMLLLNNSTKMEFATLQRLAELVKKGAVVYGPKPSQMLGLKETKSDSAAFVNLANELWKNNPETNYGKGKIISEKPLSEVLAATTPAFSTNTQDAKEIMFIHKKIGETEVFFIFNQQNRTLNREILFRVTEKTPEIWNPEDGKVISPAIYSVENNQLRMPLSLKAYESKIIIFKNVAPTYYLKQVTVNGKTVFPLKNLSDTALVLPQVSLKNGKLEFSASNTNEYSFLSNTGKIITKKIEQPKIVDLTTTRAKIEFFSVSNESINPVEITGLKSFTDFEDPAIKYFSGKAKYTINFSMPESFFGVNDSVMLNLGKFSACAEVVLNGKLVAYAWNSNMLLNISGILKAENKLEITVTNVCRNRFIGDLVQFGSIKSLWTTSPIESILNKNMPLKPSGLIGPMKLIGYNNLKKGNELPSVDFEVIELDTVAIIDRKHTDIKDNKYGFEGGRIVEIGDTLHWITSEMFGEPKIVKMRLAHWKSKKGTDKWERVSTLYESSGEFTGADIRSALWGPMPIFDEQKDLWNLFYVSYRSKPNTDRAWYLNYDGKVWRSVSTIKGISGIKGPYINDSIIMEYGEKSDPWEGLQGVDSFFPFEVNGKWLSFYGSAQTQFVPCKFWGVGLAQSNSLDGKWMRLTDSNPTDFNSKFAENPIVSKLDNNIWIALVDGGHINNNFGFAISENGILWSHAKFINLNDNVNKWWSLMRTPLCIINEGDGYYTIYFTAYTKNDFASLGKVKLKRMNLKK